MDRDRIESIAELARLELSTDEIDRFARQFTEILEFFGTLEKVDTSSHTPAATDDRAALRDDTPGATLELDDSMRNNPSGDPRYFSVPKILDEDAS